jgi:magnesium and cobalt transporter|tara:strand:- start:2209 stop:3051 length:843 start_codon:yes stop_codon:yes gene_type:complete
MNDDNTTDDADDKSWLDKLSNIFSAEPQSRNELLELLREAEKNEIIDNDALRIFEGAMQVSDLQVREIMVPRSQMKLIKVDSPIDEILPLIIDSSHSRFPVIGESSDDLKGILLAKDLLPLLLDKGQDFELEPLLRTAHIVPESKRLNVLLREFRENRNHMVVVIDEYGDIAGLATIEDVLEEIVGEIEDETDAEEDAFIKKISDGDYIIKALAPIEEVNEELGTDFDDDEVDTIGGIVTQHFGHVPQLNEEATIDNSHFKILKADNRRVHLLRMRINAD